MGAGLAARAAQRLWQPAAQRIVAGQPIWQTHAHLLSEGELTPGIHGNEFAARRQALADKLPPGAVALLPAAPVNYMAGVVPYPYRQSADFLYLTGVAQSGLLAAIKAGTGGAPASYTLFVPPPTPERDIWDGARINEEAATEVFGAHAAFPMTELEPQLTRLLTDAPAVFHDPFLQSSASQGGLAGQVSRYVQQSSQRGAYLKPLQPLTHALRRVKSPAEVQLMRQSASIAAEGICESMAASAPGVSEHHLAARFEYHCKAAGAQRLAYPSVVASGADAVTIHYGRNDKLISAGELLLMDAGCERHGYTSDVTRTWPVSGTFSPAQRDLYDIVLDTHGRCLEECRPGSSLQAVHALSVRLLREGLRSLGILGPLASSNAYRAFYPHAVGHYLGLDTHDCAGNSSCLLQAGMVITIEPGLYIPDDPAYGDYAGIGIRLEDDVAITAAEPEVLSGQAPLAPQDVEYLVGQRLRTRA